MSDLAASLTLSPAGGGRWRALADAHFEAGNGMYGGWTCALMLKSVLEDSESTGSASAITVNFISRVPPGAALTLETRKRGGGRSISHWSCELLGEDGDLLAMAAIVLANRRESDCHSEYSMPEAPAPETLAFSRPPDSFGDSVDMRTTIGADFFNQQSSRSVHWEKETTRLVLDAIQLAFLSDLGVPRIFFISEAPRPSATLTLSLYFHATADELAACGDEHILADMIGTRAECSTFGMKKDMWSRGGKLLATTEQLCWFR